MYQLYTPSGNGLLHRINRKVGLKNRFYLFIEYLSIGVIWSDNEIIDYFAVVNQNTESYDNKYTV